MKNKTTKTKKHFTPTCPHCGKELEHLVFDSNESGYFYLDGKECADYKYKTGDTRYYCPSCTSVLTYDENEAERFLRGEIKIKK